jgi:hypothetical protein
MACNHHSALTTCPQALPLVEAPGVAPVALGLLYHLSVDDKARHMFVYAGAAVPLADMLMRAQVRAAGVVVVLFMQARDSQDKAVPMWPVVHTTC